MSLPPGAQVWKEIGGWNALTDTQFATVQSAYSSSLLLWAQGDTKKGKQPKEPQKPVGLIEERKTRTARVEAFTDKSDGWIERFGGNAAEFQQERFADWGDDWATRGPQQRHRDRAQEMLAWSTGALPPIEGEEK